MTSATRERVRLLLIGSTVLAAILLVVLGVPRLRAWLTPTLLRAHVASRAVADPVVGLSPQEVAAGDPVTLYALIEARPWGSDRTELYGTVPGVQMAAGEPVLPVQAWKSWWLQPEFLWFKVEPAYPYANEQLDPAFDPDRVGYVDNYQVGWGFDWTHAADVQATGDAYPKGDTGTMRFSVRAVLRDFRGRIVQRARAPGADSVRASEPTERPHRVTVIAGPDPIGRLQGFAGLPYVPLGSAPARERLAGAYLGGTVLDFWLLANRQAGTYSGSLIGWEQLPRVADVVVDDLFLARDGKYYPSDDPLHAVSWERVQSGDLLAIDDHIGVLWQDRGPGGRADHVLDRWDRALEAYFEPLRVSALGDAFVADVRVYRIRAPAANGH